MTSGDCKAIYNVLWAHKLLLSLIGSLGVGKNVSRGATQCGKSCNTMSIESPKNR
jgi:hypothetical protein